MTPEDLSGAALRDRFQVEQDHIRRYTNFLERKAEIQTPEIVKLIDLLAKHTFIGSASLEEAQRIAAASQGEPYSVEQVTALLNLVSRVTSQ